LFDGAKGAVHAAEVVYVFAKFVDGYHAFTSDQASSYTFPFMYRDNIEAVRIVDLDQNPAAISATRKPPRMVAVPTPDEKS
jgi:hypothetical protein